jgi:hypothetical protein
MNYSLKKVFRFLSLEIRQQVFEHDCSFVSTDPHICVRPVPCERANILVIHKITNTPSYFSCKNQSFV